MAQSVVFQGLQIATVLLCTPLLRGIMNRLKALAHSKHGPSIWQPSCDLWKWLRKDSVVSEHASWVFRLAPLFSFLTPLIVVMLIPALTTYPLSYAFMGDMLAGGFILSPGGFFPSLAAMDTASTLVAWTVSPLAQRVQMAHGPYPNHSNRQYQSVCASIFVIVLFVLLLRTR